MKLIFILVNVQLVFTFDDLITKSILLFFTDIVNGSLTLLLLKYAFNNLNTPSVDVSSIANELFLLRYLIDVVMISVTIDSTNLKSDNEIVFTLSSILLKAIVFRLDDINVFDGFVGAPAVELSLDLVTLKLISVTLDAFLNLKKNKLKIIF